MRRIAIAALCLIATLALLSCQSAEPPTNLAEGTGRPTTTEAAKKTPATDLEALSNRLVSQVAGVKEGDIVLIGGGVRDLELLEDLSTDVRKVGAFPLLTINSDRIAKEYYEEVPEKYDSQSPELDLKLATMATVAISVDASEAEGIPSEVPPARLAAVGKTFEPVAELFLERNVRQVAVGNGLYPTEWRAKRFGMPQEELARTFWASVNTDYSALQASGERIRAALAAGEELHITNPNGTDLKVRIEGRPFFVSDGIISAEDVRKGGPAVSVYLPAGEVYCAPVPGTAEGKVVVSRDFYQGKEITDFTLTFVSGKLTSMTGSGPGFSELKAQYDASGAGKELFGFVDFGINPNFSIPAASKLGNWIQAGMITVGTGNNTWAGGDSKVSFGTINHLPGSTVTLDGKTIVENGVLKLYPVAPSPTPTVAPSLRPRPTASESPSPLPTKSGSPPPQPSPAPQGQDWNALVQQEVQRLRDSKIVLNAPLQMQQGKRERVEARISSTDIGEALTEGLKGRGIPQVDTIKVSPIMKVVLTGDEGAFSIEKFSNEEQTVAGKPFAEWDWDVTPLQSGIHSLHLQVTATIYVPDRGEKPVDVPVIDKTIEVEVDMWYASKQFVGNNWQWLWITLVIPIGGWIWRNRRKKPPKGRV